ncbi:tripartite tricarboxylate transporter substrate binding protein [soil metagenome]
MQRRTLIGLAAGLGAVTALRGALAQTAEPYPVKPVKIVVGFPPGQASDTIARMLAAKLTDAFGQSFIVDNKPGAAGIVAHEFVKNAKPDGYTLLVGSTATLAVNPALYRNLPYDPLKDFVPVALLISSPMYLIASPELPVASFREFVAYARERPGKLSYASAGAGTSSHIIMETLKKREGLDIVHVPFKGSSPALASVQSGDTPIAFDTATAVTPQAQAGKVKVLATTATKPTLQFPNAPALAEAGLADFVFVPWAAMVAPAGTPAPIVEKLNAALNRALQEKEMQTFVASIASVTRAGTPDALQKFMRGELALWGEAVRTSGAKLD